MTRPWLSVAVAAIAAIAATGCQSTQDKSAEIAASLGPVSKEKGLKITEESTDVEVVDTALVYDKAAGTGAVVVTLHNDSDQDLTNVPIAIDVLDAKGKSVYENNIPGIEPALASMPFIAAGADADWVHNQVLATGTPDKVEVKVGEGGRPFTGEQPDITVTDAKLEGDPTSGIEATGDATNNTDERQPRLLIYGVARQGDEVVAAGRAAIDHINAGRTTPYHIFFVGDPTGADLSVTSYPTLATQ